MKNEHIRYKEWHSPHPTIPYIRDIVDIEHGGTGADNEIRAVYNLEGISVYDIGMPGGAIPLDMTRKIPLEKFHPDLVDRVTGGNKIDGPLLLEENDVGVYQITNFNSFKDYTLKSYIGDSVIDEDIIHLKPVVGTKIAGFYLNRTLYVFNVNTSYLEKPKMIEPYVTEGIENEPIQIPNKFNSRYKFNGAIDFSGYHWEMAGVTFKSSPFLQLYHKEQYLYHTHSDWQLATDVNFTNIVASSMGDSSNLTTWMSPTLETDMVYYTRVRYMAQTGEYSFWSEPMRISTKITKKPTYWNGEYIFDGSIDYTGYTPL